MKIEQESLLSLQDVVYAYPDEEPALREISIDIRRGERIAVLGNNGAGKSTFFLICNGILRPQQGRISFAGEEIRYTKKDLTELRKKVGIVFQDADNQIIASTVESEISFGPMNLCLPLREVERLVDEAVEQMDLEAYRQRPPQYLSGGEKKRVSIADILAMRPEIILFDEPTASLDPENTALLEETLDKLSKRGITLVVSTHDVDFAYRWAERVLVFHQGKIIADDTPLRVFQQEELLKKANLRHPMLYDVCEILKKKGIIPDGEMYPKNMEEFRTMTDHL